MYLKSDLEDISLNDLKKIAKDKGIKGYSKMNKEELIKNILATDEEIELKDNDTNVLGHLDIMVDGYGFLRVGSYAQTNEDVYVAHSQIRKFNLKKGDFIEGIVRDNSNDKSRGLVKIISVNGRDLQKIKNRPNFDNLVPIYPEENLYLEPIIKEKNKNIGKYDMKTARLIDLVSPIGRGQRGLIVAPPKVGKTTIIKDIGNAIINNYEDVKLIILLIDERPEEVTDIERSVPCEVVASTFDALPSQHIKIAEMIMEKAKRLVESGEDIVILLDSITRLGRAYNLVSPPSGKTLSGGLDPTALAGPKKFLGAARNIEDGGSLTILATALVETGSKMDDVIFEEFKGTGNMELVLDRDISNERIFPAIDIKRSGTRREEKLLNKEKMEFMYFIRKIKKDKKDLLLDFLVNIDKTKDNESLIELNKNFK